ncbi:DNA polymerase delta subunit 4-like [Ostrea edulis]|uniref:DNA polymerase delta subunit 4-like n=1 Tax=Ostrea edulis TaxID=37623 RepID=UPI0024AE8C6A|nr:DNA polymerase delta subunit 4-like [Ostrea edulis]
MATKHITDSYPKVKKPSKEQKCVKDQLPSTSYQHQPVIDLTDDLKILKNFDLTLEYGPCTGITRLERWERAHKHGLNPPNEVKDILLKNKDSEEYTLCLWRDYEI